MQHADELAELFDGDLLGGEALLELLLEIVEAAPPVEHLQQGEFFLLKAEVVQPDRLLHDPIDSPLIALPFRGQVGPFAQSQPAGGSWTANYRQAWAWIRPTRHLFRPPTPFSPCGRGVGGEG